MGDIDITVRLPETLVEQAKAEGILDDARIARLIQAEIDRVNGWRALDNSLEPVRAAFRADHADLSEDDVIALVTDIVEEVRHEHNPTEDDPTSDNPSS